MKRKISVLLFILAIVGLFGFGITMVVNPKYRVPQNKFTVTTSFYPMYILTKNIAVGAKDVDVNNLTKGHTGCLHDYQITTSDRKIIENTDVLVMNGGMDDFVMDILNEDTSCRVINVGTENVDTSNFDEHDWMNIKKYRGKINTILKGLSLYDPINKDLYIHNSKKYDKEIELLEEQLKEVESLSGEIKVVSFHKAFESLIESAGMEIMYTLDMDEEEGILPDEVTKVVEIIKENNIKVLIAENNVNTNVIDLVAAETKANIYCMDTLVYGEDTLKSYVDGMRNNILVLEGIKEGGNVHGK